MKKKYDHRREKKAFSLIEVLLAMALFSVSIYLISQTFSSTFLVLESIQEHDNSDNLYSLVREEIFTIEEREKLEEGGTFPLPNDQEARWEAELEETEMVDLFLCEIEIEIDDQEEITSKHWLLRPGWSESSEQQALLDDKKQAYEDKYGFLDR